MQDTKKRPQRRQTPHIGRIHTSPPNQPDTSHISGLKQAIPSTSGIPCYKNSPKEPQNPLKT